MRAVLGLISFVVVLAIVLFSYKLYFSKMASEKSGVVTPIQTIDVVGVKNDLIAIGQAERTYQAEHGEYTSLSELTSSGALTMRRSGRDGYTYDVEASASSFRAVAHCPATATDCTNYAIDESMELRAVP